MLNSTGQTDYSSLFVPLNKLILFCIKIIGITTNRGYAYRRNAAKLSTSAEIIAKQINKFKFTPVLLKNFQDHTRKAIISNEIGASIKLGANKIKNPETSKAGQTNIRDKVPINPKSEKDEIVSNSLLRILAKLRSKIKSTHGISKRVIKIQRISNNSSNIRIRASNNK